MALKLITPPAVEPVTLEQAQAQLRNTKVSDETMIETLIVVARQHVEGLLRRALITQTWDLYLDRFPCSEIKIPKPPLQSVTHVRYDDENGDEQTIDDDNYTVDSVNEPGWVLPVDGSYSWPTTFNGVNAVRVRFVAGYPPDTGQSPADLRANVPAPINQAILLSIRELWGIGERNLFVSAEEVPGVISRSYVVSDNAARAMSSVCDRLLTPYVIYE